MQNLKNMKQNRQKTTGKNKKEWLRQLYGAQEKW